MQKLIIDTIIPNIYSAKNLKQIKDGDNAIFCAGLLGKEKKDKMYENNRCGELIQKGYKFNSLSIELFGGIDNVLKELIRSVFDSKERSLNKKKKMDISIQKHNFWIGFSTFWSRMLAKRARTHIPPNRRLST